MKKYRIIISGGGTGGHIFPAISIAKAIERYIDNVEFLFVGANDRMEMEKVPEAGYDIEGLWISGFQRRVSFRNLIFPFKLIGSLLKSKRIISKFQPDLVIGTGGYASGPILFVASRKNIPSLIQEQNSYPGITNKILSRYVTKICVAYEYMERFFAPEKLIITGNPIRKDILNFRDKKDTAHDLFLTDKNNPTVLVIGGSLGARSINRAISEHINLFREHKINLIWQTGVSFEESAKETVAKLGAKGISSYKFIKEMDLAYSVADIIVSRAGAIAISELCCIGKPVILVPSPNVSENHQYKNAQSLVNKNAALLVEDVKANRKLVDTLIELIYDKEKQIDLSKNIRNIAIKDAAENIAKIAIDLIKR